jgi:hypothetical protein
MRAGKRWALTIGLALLALEAGAAEIVLEQSGVGKLVTRALFKDKGRLMLMKGVCEAYLEHPVVTLSGGRIQIASHLSGRFGANVGGQCAGIGLASDTKVSGAPVASGGVVRLTDIRIDDMKDPTARALLVDSGLMSLLPTAVDLDVRTSVQTMLAQSVSDVEATVETFTFQDVSVIGNKLSMKFDFKLVGK